MLIANQSSLSSSTTIDEEKIDERDASINHSAISNVTSIRVGLEQSHARRARLVIFARDHDLRTERNENNDAIPSQSLHHRNRKRSSAAANASPRTDADKHAIINPNHARVRNAFRTSNPAGNPGLVRLTNSIADADDPLAIPDVPDRDIVVRRRRPASSTGSSVRTLKSYPLY